MCSLSMQGSLCVVYLSRDHCVLSIYSRIIVCSIFKKGSCKSKRKTETHLFVCPSILHIFYCNLKKYWGVWVCVGGGYYYYITFILILIYYVVVSVALQCNLNCISK